MLIDHIKARGAKFKAPKRVICGELPKTSTDKIQKVVLRDRIGRARRDDEASAIGFPAGDGETRLSNTACATLRGPKAPERKLHIPILERSEA